MANPDHVAVIQQGADAWNRWRREHPDLRPDLSGARIEVGALDPGEGEALGASFDLSGADLQRAAFCDIEFRSADFRRADLQHAKFSDCAFVDCKLSDAKFEDADLSNCKFLGASDIALVRFNRAGLPSTSFEGVTLRSAAFDLATLDGTKFVEVTLDDCTFTNSSMSDCVFEDTSMRRCVFFHTNLSRSAFIGTTFDRVDLRGADLTRADLRGATGYQFDDNHAREVILLPGSTDEWSVLRRSYTGARFTFNLLFLLLFFAPIATKATFWMQVAQLEATLKDVALKAQRAVEAPSTAPGEVNDFIGALLAELASLGPCLATRCEDVSVLRLLFGLHVDFGKADWGTQLAVLTGVLLILYNLARGLLTFLVTPLRDEEERSGHTPRRFLSEPRQASPSGAHVVESPGMWKRLLAFSERVREHYGWMVRLHRVVTLLQYIAYASTTTYLYDVATHSVAVPV